MALSPFILVRDLGWGDWAHHLSTAYASSVSSAEADAGAVFVQQWREYDLGHPCHIVRCPVTEVDGPGREWAP